MDYFYMNGRLYILICDYFSKFPFLFQVKTTSFANLKDHLEELFSVEGIPDEIMSDNGPPFNGKEFSSYLTGLGIRHTTSSPNYPRSNGFIERQIQTMKRLIERPTVPGGVIKKPWPAWEHSHWEMVCHRHLKYFMGGALLQERQAQ